MISSKTKNDVIPTYDFPKLMKSKEHKYVVLFSRREKGTVVSKCSQHSIGEYDDTWRMDCFEDFTGTLELTNGVA
jgi:hypothetical protein